MGVALGARAGGGKRMTDPAQFSCAAAAAQSQHRAQSEGVPIRQIRSIR
jgi:hypothetical protein